MTTPNGAETLRARVHVWNRKGHLGPMARDCGLALSDLDDWSAGRRQQLDVAALEKIASYLDTKYDAATDTLQSAYQQKVTASTYRPQEFVSTNYVGPPLPPRLPTKPWR